MNLQHFKLLRDESNLYRHFITLAFTQHGPAQRRFAADDLNEPGPADQLHAAPIRAEKELLLLVVGIDQADHRAELYPLTGVAGARDELAPMDYRLADSVGAAGLAGGQMGSLETQCVVFVVGNVPSPLNGPSPVRLASGLRRVVSRTAADAITCPSCNRGFSSKRNQIGL